MQKKLIVPNLESTSLSSNDAYRNTFRMLNDLIVIRSSKKVLKVAAQ